jgi:hypothetical protein
MKNFILGLTAGIVFILCAQMILDYLTQDQDDCIANIQEMEARSGL